MKTCFKCFRQLPRREFYRHPRMDDGLLGKCRECTKADVKLNRQRNAERLRVYESARNQLPQRKAAHRERMLAWELKYPERKKAIQAVNNAIRDGKIVKRSHCERCGGTVIVQKHHPDYSMPFHVEWLCKPCHFKADEARRQLEATF